MGKYRLVRMNEVKYTDSERVFDDLIEQGFVLAPAFEPTAATAKEVEVEKAEEIKPKRATKTSKK